MKINNSNINIYEMKMDENKTVTPSHSQVMEALTNIKEMEYNHESKSVVAEYIKAPFKVPTPKEKVKKRPDGFDYVESAWMDSSFKESSPLYSNTLVSHKESKGWIDVIVSVTDRTTGNNELGSGSAKIQTSTSTGKVLDKGNNLTSALSKAIKNAQSRFGHAADIYRKLQELPDDDERERYETMLSQIKNINLTRSYTFAEQWDQLGTGFTDYLDRWQVYVDKQNAKSSLEGSKMEDNKKQSLI